MSAPPAEIVYVPVENDADPLIAGLPMSASRLARRKADGRAEASLELLR